MSGGSRDDVGRFTVSCTSIQFLCLFFLVSCPIFVDKCTLKQYLIHKPLFFPPKLAEPLCLGGDFNPTLHSEFHPPLIVKQTGLIRKNISTTYSAAYLTRNGRNETLRWRNIFPGLQKSRKNVNEKSHRIWIVSHTRWDFNMHRLFTAYEYTFLTGFHNKDCSFGSSTNLPSGIFYAPLLCTQILEKWRNTTHTSFPSSIYQGYQLFSQKEIECFSILCSK